VSHMRCICALFNEYASCDFAALTTASPINRVPAQLPEDSKKKDIYVSKKGMYCALCVERNQNPAFASDRI